MECGSHDHHWSSSRKLHLHNESDMKCSSLFSHSVERRQPQKWKCTCRESIFNRIAALKARIHVYIHMHIHISVYMQWHPNKSAPKMAPIVELQTWRFSVQSVEFIVTTMKTKINNGIPMVLYPLSPFRLFLCQRQWACVPCYITIGKLALQRQPERQRHMNSAVPCLMYCKFLATVFILQGYNKNSKHKGNCALQCTG